MFLIQKVTLPKAVSYTCMKLEAENTTGLGNTERVVSAVVSACSSDAGVHLSIFYRDHLKMFHRLRR